MVTVRATWADDVTVDGTCVETEGDTVDGARVETNGDTVDGTCAETDGVTVDGVCVESDSVTVDTGPLLLTGGGRGFVTLAGLKDAVESEGRSGSV